MRSIKRIKLTTSTPIIVDRIFVKENVCKFMPRHQSFYCLHVVVVTEVSYLTMILCNISERGK